MQSVRKLTARQQRFVEEYLVDLNATQAAIRAGYSEKAARFTGSENLTKPNIAEAIQKHLKKRSRRTEVTADKVIAEYALVAFADMADYIDFNSAGNVVLDWSQMPEGATKVISEITQEEFVDGKGEDARPVRRTKFKLHSKMSALNDLAKHLGMFIERHEHTEVRPDERRKRIAKLRAKLAGGRG